MVHPVGLLLDVNQIMTVKVIVQQRDMRVGLGLKEVKVAKVME